MDKKKWTSISIQTIKFENEDVITSSSLVTVVPGENETPFLPIDNYS